MWFLLGMVVGAVLHATFDYWRDYQPRDKKGRFAKKDA